MGDLSLPLHCFRDISVKHILFSHSCVVFVYFSIIFHVPTLTALLSVEVLGFAAHGADTSFISLTDQLSQQYDSQSDSPSQRQRLRVRPHRVSQLNHTHLGDTAELDSPGEKSRHRRVAAPHSFRGSRTNCVAVVRYIFGSFSSYGCLEVVSFIQFLLLLRIPYWLHGLRQCSNSCCFLSCASVFW